MADKELPEVELLHKLLWCDAEAGTLVWKPRPRDMFSSERAWKVWNTRYSNKPAFCVDDGRGYLHGSVFKRIHLTHRVIWAMSHGAWPDLHIDHINGVRDDNRISNLRVVTRTENQRNQKRSVRNRSGVVGVSWNKFTGRWMAHIKVHGKYIHLGRFDTIEEAAAVRLEAERKYGFHENHGRSG